MKSLICLALVAGLVATSEPALAGQSIISGTVDINKGVNGVTLGMTRAKVKDLLGKPLYANKNGYMEYSKWLDKSMFDIYLDPSNKVEMFGVSGKGFSISNGIKIFNKGGLKLLSQQYGSKLKLEKNTTTGDRFFAIHGRLNGKKVTTEFSAIKPKLSSTVLMITILYR